MTGKKKLALFGGVLAVGYLVLAIVAWRIVPKSIADSERRLFGVRLALAQLEQDQILLSQRIHAVTSETLGKGQRKDAEVAALLADPDVNHLAFVYLGADWSLQRSALVGAISHLRAQFEQQKGDRQGVRDRIDQREADLAAKVKKLEQRKRSLGHQITTMDRRSVGFKAKMIELDDVERQLALLRDRNTYWETQRRDDIRRDQSDEVFAEARAKTEAEVFRVANEYQANTVGTLIRVLAEKRGDLKFEANRPDRLRRILSPFNIWPINWICRMPLEGEDAKPL